MNSTFLLQDEAHRHQVINHEHFPQITKCIIEAVVVVIAW